MFDLAMIKSVYEHMNERINAARVILGRPLTLTEKILYSHLATGNPSEQFKRGRSYVDFQISDVDLWIFLRMIMNFKWLYLWVSGMDLDDF